MSSSWPSVLLALTAALPAQTYVVDQRGSGNFTDLPQAIAAVPSGAVLRVRPGTYSAFSVQNKSLAILGDSSSTVIVNANTNVVIGPTMGADRIVVHGMKVLFAPTGRPPFALDVRDAAGPVVLDDLEVNAQVSSLPIAQCQTQISRSRNVHVARLRSLLLGRLGPPALIVQDSRVEIVSSAFSPGLGATSSAWNASGNPGVELHNSRVLLVDCDVEGCRGHDAIDFAPAGAGGPAVLVAGGSVVHVHGSRSRYVGGAGGNGYQGVPVRPGGRGGDGFALFSSSAHCIGVSPRGGPPGTGAPAGRPYGLDESSTLQQFGGQGPTARLVGTPGPLNTVTCSLAANPNDLALPFLGLTATFVTIPGLLTHGGVLCTLDVVATPMLVPGSGVLDLVWQMPHAWPYDRPIPFQFLVVPSGLQEVWASNSTPILVKS